MLAQYWFFPDGDFSFENIAINDLIVLNCKTGSEHFHYPGFEEIREGRNSSISCAVWNCGHCENFAEMEGKGAGLLCLLILKS